MKYGSLESNLEVRPIPLTKEFFGNGSPRSLNILEFCFGVSFGDRFDLSFFKETSSLLAAKRVNFRERVIRFVSALADRTVNVSG